MEEKSGETAVFVTIFLWGEKMVSIIVAAYNVEKYLPQCIESILAQTYRDFELIFVDDGSTDGSSELGDFYGKRDMRVKVIHKPNGGLVSARKAGIAEACGEYIGFVDGDDWIESDMYENLMKIAVGFNADIVLCGSIEDAKGECLCKINGLKSGVYDKTKMAEELYPYMLCMKDFFGMGVQPYLWNKLIRREYAYKHIMAVDDRIRVGEDVAAVMPMLLAVDRTVVTDYCGYHYCMHSESMMWSNSETEKERNELSILHDFLRMSFRRYAGQYQLEYQLVHYTVGNFLTRMYGRLADRGGKRTLWPFDYHISSRKCILYSAGNFGRAVYRYMQNCYLNVIELWVDREYRMYQCMGLPVQSVDDIRLNGEHDILVAVLDVKLAGSIKKSLMQSGARSENIYCINITETDVGEILKSL